MRVFPKWLVTKAQRILPEVMVGFAIALPTLHFTGNEGSTNFAGVAENQLPFGIVQRSIWPASL